MTASNTDTHRLVHYPGTHGLSETTTGEARILAESCTSKLPFGWLFLFGSRNIWEPGQTVGERGGAAAERAPTVTPMDVAQVRLHEASTALREDRTLGPACAGLKLLERLLDRAGDRGQLRLQSPPGAFGKGENDPMEKRHRFLERVAVAENVIYQLGLKNRDQIEVLLETLRGECSYVPAVDPARGWKELQKALRSLGGRHPVAEGPVRLLVGWPLDGRMGRYFADEAPRVAALFEEQAATAPSASSSGKPWWAFWK